MFNVGAFAKIGQELLNNLDNAAKETLEEPTVSATALRSKLKEIKGHVDEEDHEIDDEEHYDYVEDEETEDKTKLKTSSWDFNEDDASENNDIILNQDHEIKVKVIDELNQQIEKDGVLQNPSINTSITENEQQIKKNGDELSFFSKVEQELAPKFDEVEEKAKPLEAFEITPTKEKKIEIPKQSSEKIPTTPMVDFPIVSEIPKSVKQSTVDEKNELKSEETSSMKGSKKLTKIKSSGSSNDIVFELKKSLKKKNQEIEKLNQECLELEENCTSLKQEVKEAWDNYKQAQEKAILNESDLQDELKQLQKSKQFDKQQLNSQITKLNEELSTAIKQTHLAQKEKESIQQQLLEMERVNQDWNLKLQNLQQELIEARASSNTGVQFLRDELQAAKQATESVRSEYNILLKQNQARQMELEKVNTELSGSLAEMQRELQRVNASTGLNPIGNIGTGDDRLQQELMQLNIELSEEREKIAEMEGKLKQSSSELRAAEIRNEDERNRYNGSIEELNKQISQLQEQLRSVKRGDVGKSVFGPNSGFLLSSSMDEKDGKAIHVIDEEGSTIGEWREVSESEIKAQFSKLQQEAQEQRMQSQNLSKLLLKKQGTLVELQAERTALKNRLADVLKRCEKAEEQLVSYKDYDTEDYSSPEAEVDEEMGTKESYQKSNEEFLLDHMEENRKKNGLKSKAKDKTLLETKSLVSSSLDNNISNRSTNRMRLRNKNNYKNSAADEKKMISDLERFGVKPGTRITSAFVTIDTWALVTGRFLKSYPLARLGFVLYLLVLHFWVLFILVVHTHSLDVDNEPSVINKIQ